MRWYDFLSLFVAQRMPDLTPSLRALAPLLYQTAMGIGGVTFPADPIENEPDYASALAAFEAAPPVRILFDNGAGSSTPGAPVAAFEQSFSRFPLPGTARQGRGTWARVAACRGLRRGRGGVDVFNWSPRARPLTDFTGNTGPGGLWGTSPNYHWTQNPAGTALSYVTAPLPQNLVVVGAGALHAWIEASTPDVDLQVTVSEVRPDGNETFVQSGWLDASERKLSPQSTLLEPLLSERKADVRPLPRGRFTEVVVPLYYEGHVYRAGSRIRITISAPGGDQPTWAFARPGAGGPRDRPGGSLAGDAVADRSSRWCRASRSRPAYRRARACAASRAGGTCR